MKPFHILVATPLGKDGKGGIDRMMDSVRAELAKNPPENMTVRFGTTRGSGHILFSPFFLLAFLARMVVSRLLRRCDLVHINLSSRGSTRRKLAVGALARTLGTPYIVHLHGGQYREFFADANLTLQKKMRRLYTCAAHVLVLGSPWGRFIEKTLGVPRERITVLPNAAPRPRLEHRANATGTARILFLGKLGLGKGTPQLIQALARLNDRSDWHATLAGNGEVEGTRSDVARVGIADRVLVPGWVGQEETEKLLASSDILVLPSFAENLPMSVIEGMAAGLAVVTTPVGATPDIIKDGETGLLVPPGDVDALAAALERLIQDEALRVRLGQAAQDFHREHLEIGVYARRLVELWKRAAR